MKSEKVNILGTFISIIDLQEAVYRVLNFVESRQKHYICVAPVSTIVDGYRDCDYRDILNKAVMVTPDGMPVVWVAKYLKGEKEIGRTYGPDLMRRVCQLGQASGIRHFLYGSTPETLESLINQLMINYPEIKIVGSYSPPFKPLADKESQEIIDMINQSGADIVWVGLGSPKQDKWMALNRTALKAPILIGIGAAFDFIAGTKPQAPKWMQQIGLEWFFRLCCEPRRLWKRYLVGNTIFIFAIIKECFLKDRGYAQH